MVYVTVTDSDGNNKPLIHLAGMSFCSCSFPSFLFFLCLVGFVITNILPLTGYSLWDVPSCVRPTLHRTVFPDIWTVNERNMSDIIWELYKEVGRFYEDEFYHVPDLQYYVKIVSPADVAFPAW